MPENSQGIILNGKIQTGWNLNDDQGNRIANGPLRCEFYLTSAQQGGNSSSSVSANGNAQTQPIPLTYKFKKTILCSVNFSDQSYNQFNTYPLKGYRLYKLKINP